MQSSHLSDSDEWMTPKHIIDAVREALGGTIELDPASSDVANEYTRAERYFTFETNGLAHPWHGRVFMNPPYGGLRMKAGRPSRIRGGLAARFADKLIAHYELGDVKEAVMLLSLNSLSALWYQPILQYPFVLVRGRLSFIPGAGQNVSANAGGSVLVYMGKNVYRFGRIFSDIGTLFAKVNG